MTLYDSTLLDAIDGPDPTDYQYETYETKDHSFIRSIGKGLGYLLVGCAVAATVYVIGAVSYAKFIDPNTDRESLKKKLEEYQNETRINKILLHPQNWVYTDMFKNLPKVDTVKATPSKPSLKISKKHR